MSSPYRPIQPDGLYAQPELAAFGINFTRQHLYLLAKRGHFPAAIKVGRGRTARNYWLGRELIAFLEERVKMRDEGLKRKFREPSEQVQAA